AAQAARPQSASGIMPTLQVPAYDLSAAAGSGRAILDDAPTSYVAFPADWARAFTGPTGDAQALALMTVAGDSMTPTLAHGDQILVHLSPSPRGWMASTCCALAMTCWSSGCSCTRRTARWR
ncbi:MAG: S24 family peptidase, partial [Pseudomonadota bacterium]|nr:S24 family peptidase [Pseudomonadota bacterium]